MLSNRKVEHRLVLLRTLALRKNLPLEGLVQEHPEVELRLRRDVTPHRIVPHREIRHLRGIPRPLDEAHLVVPRIVHLVVVLVLHGIDPVGDRFEVLRNENPVVLRTRDHRRLVLEDRRVVLRNLFHRVRRVEPDERLRHRIRLVAVRRVARHHHRVDLRARREDVAHRIERIPLVVVLDRAPEIQRIRRVRKQRVPKLDHDPAASHRDRRLLLHLRRGEELLLLVLDLHELVELDVDLPVVRRRTVRREIVRDHRHDHRRQRVPRPSRGGHRARATAPEGRQEQYRNRQPKRVHLMSKIRPFHCFPFCVTPSSGAWAGFTIVQPPVSVLSIHTACHGRKTSAGKVTGSAVTRSTRCCV